MVADGGLAASCGARRAEELQKSTADLGEVGKGLVKLGNLLTYEVKNVRTRAATGPSNLDNFPDLAEAET